MKYRQEIENLQNEKRKALMREMLATNKLNRLRSQVDKAKTQFASETDEEEKNTDEDDDESDTSQKKKARSGRSSPPININEENEESPAPDDQSTDNGHNYESDTSQKKKDRSGRSSPPININEEKEESPAPDDQSTDNGHKNSLAPNEEKDKIYADKDRIPSSTSEEEKARSAETSPDNNHDEVEDTQMLNYHQEQEDLDRSSSPGFHGFTEGDLHDIPREALDSIPSPKPSSSNKIESLSKAAKKDEKTANPSDASERKEHHEVSPQPSTSRSNIENIQMSARGEEKIENEALVHISSSDPFNTPSDDEDSIQPMRKTPKVVLQKESNTRTDKKTGNGSKEDIDYDSPIEALTSISSKEKDQYEFKVKFCGQDKEILIRNRKSLEASPQTLSAENENPNIDIPEEDLARPTTSTNTVLVRNANPRGSAVVPTWSAPEDNKDTNNNKTNVRKGSKKGKKKKNT